MRRASVWGLGLVATVLIAAAADAAGYDGTYGGTSAVLIPGSRKNNACTEFKAPAPLTISNGHVQGKWGSSQEFDGTVDGSGKVVMHSSVSGRFDGQIDASGTLKGSYSGGCDYTLTWQRRG